MSEKSGHYQPFVLAADNNDSGEDENEANKVVNGDHFWHSFNTNGFNFTNI
jgi:hypothetical protein